ncbi:DUF4062 domain-containing protein [Staphylococcus epidermidis]|nr:DUF4062 domain-containing protein [Staphylococcus epidermidis]MCG1263352.1 DUF4062 domain-containing protein [Staphylococcus epidermidis]MCG1303477.1 DUF4062 domain-containing protein [Staphylococcus epidermidis]MCG1361461.1 DUF4062 domain-containing protein [Staphylococcus epidermidis]MCG1386585.1 DUF4062 domain-containing protein [Staphylococcus epidermidis]
MKNIKHQIFISSTYVDLIDERQKVVESVLESSNIPAGMELFTGANIEQWEIIKEWIDESDVFILLLGGRYGTLAIDEDISYIEKEYNYARKQEIPTYVFILSDSYLYTKKAANPSLAIFEQNNRDKYDVFKDKLLEHYAKTDIDTIDKLKNEVYRTLTENKEYWSGGWIKNNNSNENTTNTKKDRDIELYKKQKKDLIKVKDIINHNYENSHNISNDSMVELIEFCKYYAKQDPVKKYIDKSVQSNIDNMVQNIYEYIELVENHRIFLPDEQRFKFRPYGNEYGERNKWVKISEEEAKEIEKKFKDLSESINSLYISITNELEHYLK